MRILLPLALAAEIGPVDVVRHDGRAYAFIDQLLTRAEADQACAMLSSAVARIETDAELWFLHDQLHDGRRLNSGGWSWVVPAIGTSREGAWILQYDGTRTPAAALQQVDPGGRQRVICERAIR